MLPVRTIDQRRQRARPAQNLGSSGADHCSGHALLIMSRYVGHASLMMPSRRRFWMRKCAWLKAELAAFPQPGDVNDWRVTNLLTFGSILGSSQTGKAGGCPVSQALPARALRRPQ